GMSTGTIPENAVTGEEGAVEPEASGEDIPPVEMPAGTEQGGGAGQGESVAPSGGAVNPPEQPVADVPAVQPPADESLPPQNILSAGTITASLDSSNPKTKVVAGISTVDVVAFKLAAKNETFKITDVSLALNDISVIKSIQSVALNYGGQEVIKMNITPEAVSKNLIVFNKLNLSLSPSSAKTLTVSYQLNDVSDEFMSGKDVRTALYAMKAVDMKSKTFIYSSPLKGNSVYVYKTYPTISSVALSSASLVKGINTLGKFSVANSGGSKLGWRRMTVTFKCRFDAMTCRLSYGNPVIKTDGLYNLEVLGPGVAPGEERQDLLVKSINLYRIDNIGFVTNQILVPGTWQFEHYSDGTVKGIFIANADQEVAGTKTYYLKGDVLPNLVANDFVSSQIANPSKAIVSVAGSGQKQMNADTSLVWTDFSATSHTLTSGDWHNDYLIKNLPSAEQIVVNTAFNKQL
ncbi:MAG: hypothetical protein ABII98_01260, partial [bacterium]